MTHRKNSPPLATSHLPKPLAGAVDAIEAERIRQGIGHTIIARKAGYDDKHWKDAVTGGNVRIRTLIDMAMVLDMDVKIEVEKRK